MKERGMIFNAEMIRALLSGQKTQTRRPYNWKLQPAMEMAERDDGTTWPWAEDCENGGDIWFPCPFGAAGDRIWVRETWAEAGASAPDLKLYRANYPEHVPSSYENVPPADEVRWTPSIHMPRWASRILLEITAVRVEKLNSISEVDAKAEGMKDSMPILEYARLWNGIYPDKYWQSNPWVWVIEFKRVTGATR